jgi:hypothetical protein
VAFFQYISSIYVTLTERPWMMLDSASLAMLLDGIDYSRVRRPKHWQPKTISDRHRSSNVVEAGDGQ